MKPLADEFKQAATMLRQLQAENEALKKEAALQRLSDFTQEADNEPVAWIDPRELDMEVSTTVTKNKWDKDDIPLYTHSAKTLTDEEILDVWVSSNFVRYTENGQIDEIFFNKFANAILRKANEK